MPNPIARAAAALGLIVRDDPAPPAAPITIPARDQIGPDSALSMIAVYRAVQLLELGVAGLSIDVWRGRQLLDRPSLIRKPDIDMRLRQWLKLNIGSLALRGNAYWRIKTNDQGVTANVKVLPPHKCSLRKDGTLSVAGEARPLRPDEFRHLGLLRIPGRLDALGPIQAAREELAGAREVSRYGAEFFNSGDVPTGLLTSDQPLTKAEADQAKAAWQAREKREVAVLGKGLSYSPVLLSPEDAQFIATRQFDTTAIARLFGVPAHLLLAVIEGKSMTYTNISQADLTFVRWSLGDYFGEIEDALSSVLPGQQEARFNLDGILRPDTASRYAAHQLGITAGFLLPSEARDIEGLPEIPGIDDRPRPTQPAPVEDQA